MESPDEFESQKDGLGRSGLHGFTTSDNNEKTNNKSLAIRSFSRSWKMISRWLTHFMVNAVGCNQSQTRAFPGSLRQHINRNSDGIEHGGLDSHEVPSACKG